MRLLFRLFIRLPEATELNSISRLRTHFKIFVSGCVALCFLIISGCNHSISEQSALAQTNQINTSSVSEQSEIEILNGVADPCRQKSPDFDTTPNKDSPDFRLYELVNNGFPKEIPLEEAVAVFNRFAQCSKIGKAQPPLRAEEVAASIRMWVCERDAPFEDKKRACEEFRKIAETGKMPKGSFIDVAGGTSNYRGYDVDAWQIYLNIRLDKYSNDLKDVPSFSRLIRLNYISSKPTEMFKNSSKN